MRSRVVLKYMGKIESSNFLAPRGLNCEVVYKNIPCEILAHMINVYPVLIAVKVRYFDQNIGLYQPENQKSESC